MKPEIMGILNVTPDSFSDGGRWMTVPDAVQHGRQMADEGATWIDVGGESTRPGSEPVPLQEELRRVIPVIEQLAAQNIAVSVDTQKPEVARAALESGAQMINDVSGFRYEAMMAVVSDLSPAVCIMHMQGDPGTMQVDPSYRDVVNEVYEFLLAQAKRIESLGVPRERVYIDPGIGFGKTVEHNASLVANLPTFVESNYPVLLGVSRKSWIGVIGAGPGTQPLPVQDREESTIAIQSFAQLCRVRMIRTHDVRGAVRARNALSAILIASSTVIRP